MTTGNSPPSTATRLSSPLVVAIANAVLAPVSSRPIDRELRARAPAATRARGLQRDDDEDRHGDGARGGDAGERVVLGGAVEEDEREADAERGDAARA